MGQPHVNSLREPDSFPRVALPSPKPVESTVDEEVWRDVFCGRPGKYECHFHLCSVGQNSVMGPHPATRDAGKCSPGKENGWGKHTAVFTIVGVYL